MTMDEVEGRLAALEVIALTALGLYLANVPDDPEMERARGALGYMRGMVEDRAVTMKPEAAAAARGCGDDLLSIVLENMHTLRARS